MRDFLFILLFSFLLGSCSKIISPSSGSGSITLSGVVQLARVNGAIVTVYELLSDGQKGRLLATTLTDSEGLYTVSLGSFSGHVIVESTGGTYIDEATSQTKTASTMSAIVAASAASNAPLTPMSTLVRDRTVALLQTSASLSDAKSQALTEVARIFGVTPEDIEVIPTAPTALTSLSTRATRAGLGIAAFSYFLKDFRFNGNEVTVAEALSTLSKDLEDDGQINGTGLGARSVKLAVEWKSLFASARQSAKDAFPNLTSDILTEVSSTLIDTGNSIGDGIQFANGKYYLNGVDMGLNENGDGLFLDKYYFAGAMADGEESDGKYYHNGVLAEGEIEGVKYHDGIPVNGTENKKLYSNGVLFTGTGNGIIGESGKQYLLGEAAFVSSWKTDNAGSSRENQINLPLTSEGIYNFTVDWGDGSQNSITSWDDANKLHTYSEAGTYTIKISGAITGFRLPDSGDAQKITNISQFGPLRLGNSGSYFSGASNLTITALDALDLTGTTDLSHAFSGCSALTTAPSMALWDTSNVNNMSGMFSFAFHFNQPISNWNVANVTNMSHMFEYTVFNQDIGSWNVSKVTDLSWMFNCANSFNRSIGNWNTSQVTDMNGLFSGATAFNQPLANWNVSNVTNMYCMFCTASSFDQDISSWNVANVLNMSQMFNFASSFNQNLTSWNVSSDTTIDWMFAGSASSFGFTGVYAKKYYENGLIYTGDHNGKYFWQGTIANGTLDNKSYIDGVRAIYVSKSPLDDSGNGTLESPYLTAQKAFEEAYKLTGPVIIQLGEGNFGGVNLRIANASEWPSNISVRGVSVAASNLGGINADGVFWNTPPEKGRNISITCNQTANLGIISSRGGMSSINLEEAADGGNVNLVDCTFIKAITAGGITGGFSPNGQDGNITQTTSTGYFNHVFYLDGLATTLNSQGTGQWNGSIFHKTRLLPVVPSTIYVRENGSDITGDGSLGAPVQSAQMAFDLAYYSGGDRVIDLGVGNFGGVNLNTAEASEWPSRISVQGISSTDSNLGGIVADGQNEIWDYDGQIQNGLATAAKNVNVNGNNTANLGNISSRGGNSDDGGANPAANGGSVTLTNSFAGNINTSGGACNGGGAGNGGSITLTNTTAGDLQSSGGNTHWGSQWDRTGDGGQILLISSSVQSVVSSGGNVLYDENWGVYCGSGGNITLTDSTFLSNSALGGNCNGATGTNGAIEINYTPSFTSVVGSTFYANGSSAGTFDPDTNTITITGELTSAFNYNAGNKNVVFSGTNFPWGPTLSTTGSVTFSGNNYNYGTINAGSVVFNDTAHNWNSITGPVTFNDSSYNEGATITGNVTFNDSSYNKVGATVNGDITLNDSAANNGTVTGSVTDNRVTACAGDCYLEGSAPDYAQGLPIDTFRIGPGVSILRLEFANGNSGFKIWREKDGSRILNATGLVANGWQQKLNRSGVGFNSGNALTESGIISQIEGRVCPPNVFLDFNNMTATGRCLYYDSGNTGQTLDAANPANSGPSDAIEGEDWLGNWDSTTNLINPTAENRSLASYYEGNIKTCADKGMRLPVAYETTMNTPQAALPSGDGITPLWADSTTGIPGAGGSLNWLSSACEYGGYKMLYFSWTQIWNQPMEGGSYNFPIRCVLP